MLKFCSKIIIKENKQPSSVVVTTTNYNWEKTAHPAFHNLILELYELTIYFKLFFTIVKPKYLFF